MIWYVKISGGLANSIQIRPLLSRSVAPCFNHNHHLYWYSQHIIIVNVKEISMQKLPSAWREDIASRRRVRKSRGRGRKRLTLREDIFTLDDFVAATGWNTIGSPLLNVVFGNVVFHDHLSSPTSLRPACLVALDLGQHSHPISTRPDWTAISRA